MNNFLFVLLLWLAMPLSANMEPENDILLNDLNNNIHKLSEYKGKWVVVNYWATWCPPCKEEIPDLVSFHEKYKDTKAVVLGINHEYATVNELKNFKKKYSISYPVLRSTPVKPGIVGAIQGLPTTYIVNPDGAVVAYQNGPVTAEMIESYIDSFETQNNAQQIEEEK
jgi:thiol-disulfide isomerase/thioredoxin